MNNDFELTDSQLKEISEAFVEKIKEGLKEDEKEIRCIPTYIPSIQLPQNGDAYAIDLGGTNVRAAIVSFEKGNYFIKKGPCEARMPWSKDKKVYLDTQAKALQDLQYKAQCPLGYCFSFPAKSTFNGDAELIKWTKKIHVDGVVGENVGEMLIKYLKRDFSDVQCSKVAVINDTVASLISGLVKPGFDAYIGLIVGTGTNMAAFIDADNIPKIREVRKVVYPINLESGNFNPPHLTQWDKRVDDDSQNPREQIFEKAVSGAYLGNIFKKVHPESNFNSEIGAEGIAKLLSKSGRNDDYILTASQIFERSAKLVAAALAGLINLLNTMNTIERVGILAEGSLFWGTINGEYRYLSITKSTLTSLLRELGLNNVVFEFKNIKNANLIGGAIAALAK